MVVNKDIIDKIRNLHSVAVAVDYGKMRQYAVEKHEETLKILLDVANTIEKLEFVWLPKGFKWVKNYSTESYVNPLNGMNLYYIDKDAHIVWLWFTNGIQFIYNIKLHRCVFVYLRESGKYERYGYVNYHYINHKDEDGYSNGFESKITTPCMESYFPDVKLNHLEDYRKFLDNIDRDYENAVKCRSALNTTLENIAKKETEYVNICTELVSRNVVIEEDSEDEAAA